MTKENTIFDKYISQSNKKRRMGCLSIVVLLFGFSFLLSVEGPFFVLIGLLLLAGGGYLIWNNLLKPYFKPDQELFVQIREDLKKWAQGEVEASYEKVFEVINSPFVFDLKATYEHDKVDDKIEMSIPLINYVEQIKEGEQKRVSKIVMWNWSMTINPNETQEYFHLARKAMDSTNKQDSNKRPFIYANGNKYFFLPLDDAESDGVNVMPLIPLSNDYFSSALINNKTIDSKDFLFRFYLDDGNFEDIEFGTFEKDGRQKIVNGLWVADLLSKASKEKSQVRKFVNQIKNNNDDSTVIEDTENSNKLNQLVTGFDTEGFSMDGLQDAFEAVKKEKEEKKN